MTGQPIVLKRSANIFVSDALGGGDPHQYVAFLPTGSENLWQPYTQFNYGPDLMRNGRSGWIVFTHIAPDPGGAFAAHLRQYLPKGYTGGIVWGQGTTDGKPTMIVPFSSMASTSSPDGVGGQSQGFTFTVIADQAWLNVPNCQVVWTSDQPNWIQLQPAPGQLAVLHIGGTIVTTPMLGIPAGTRRGVLVAQHLQLPLAQVPVVQTYVAQGTTLSYPVLATGQLLADLDALVLDPTNSFFEIPLYTAGQPWSAASGFRSSAGDVLSLSPVTTPDQGTSTGLDRWDPSFSRVLLLDGPRLEPAGDFSLATAVGAATDVLCGLDAREVLDFDGAAVIRFVPGGAAEYPPPASGGHTSSWIDARPGVYTGGAQQIYGGTGPILAPVDAAGITLPTADGKGFPMVPYGNVSKQLPARQELETQLLSLVRADRVLTGAVVVTPTLSTRTRAVSTSVLTSARGMVVETSNGVVVALDIARVGGQPIRITQLTTALSTALNAGTLCVVTDTGGSLGLVEGALSLGGWRFDLASLLGPTTSTTILVLKFSGNSLTDIAASTQLWTQATSFSSDAEALRARLQANVRAGIAASQAGDARWSGFAALAADPSWQGVLLFDAALSTSSLPPALASLAAGLQGVTLSADYLCLQLGQVAQVSGQWVQADSSVSGVLSYTNTSAAPAASANGDATMTVRALEVAFRESVPDALSASVDVAIANLFGAPAQGQVLSLTGQAVTVSGAERLSLASTAPVTLTTSGMVESVTLSSAALATEHLTAGASRVRATLELAGGLKFRTITPDIFSLDTVQFTGMRFGLDVPLTNGVPGTPSVTFDASAFQLVISTAAPRPGSFAANFPIRLTGLQVQPNGIDLGSLGYLPLPTTNSSSARPTYAVTADLSLGSPGAKAPGTTAFTAQLALGWTSASLQPSLGFKLPGGGGRKSIGLQGVFELDFDTLLLSQVNDGTGKQVFAIGLGGAQMIVFGSAIPQGATLSGLLFAPVPGAGDKPPLGWWVSYQKPTTAGTALVDVSYLGLGQRLRFTPQSTVDGNLGALQGMLSQNLSQVYDASGKWLFGAKFQAGGAVEVGLVFLDTTLYGLSLKSLSTTLPNLSGQVLYQRQRDGTSRFSGTLALVGPGGTGAAPFELGVARFTLPTLAVDYWTDGQFKFNLGFTEDMSKLEQVAGSVQIGLVQGLAGVMVAKTNQQNAQGLPVVTGGTFGPVLSAGIALGIGVGKQISAGVFSGGLSVWVKGLLQGSVAWYQRNGATPSLALGPNTWYRVSGAVQLDVTLTGSLDLYVASASATLTAFARTTLTYEAYKDFTARVQASVSGTAKVKVAWWTEEKSFSFSVDETLVIAKAKGTAPWGSTRTVRAVETTPAPIVWASQAVFSTPQTLALRLGVRPTYAPGLSGAGPCAVSSFLMDTATTGSSWSPTSAADQSLSSFYAGLLGWVVACADGAATPADLWATRLGLSALLSLRERLGATDTLALDTPTILAFLGQNYATQVAPMVDDGSAPVLTALPLPPTLVVTGSNGATFDLATYAPRDSAWGPAITAWRDGTAVPAQDPRPGDPSAASWVFRDLVALGVRGVLDQAIEFARTQGDGWSIDLAGLANELATNGGFLNVAGLVGSVTTGAQQVPAASPVVGSDPAAIGLSVQTGVAMSLATQAGFTVTLTQSPGTPGAWPALAAGVTSALADVGIPDTFPGDSSAFSVTASLADGLVAGPVGLALGMVTPLSGAAAEALVEVRPGVAARLAALPPGSAIRFDWYADDGARSDSATAVAAARVRFALGSALDANGSPLPTVFSIGSFAAEDVASLEALREAVQAGATGLSVGFAVVTADGFTLPLSQTGTLVFRTGLGTLSRPSRARAVEEAPVDSAGFDDLAGLLDLLWAASVTNNGGTWIVRPDQADGTNDFGALIAAGGSQVALLVTATSETTAWMNAVAPSDGAEALAAGWSLGITLPDETETRAGLRPGEVAVAVTRAAAASSDPGEIYLRAVFGRPWARVAAGGSYGDGAPRNGEAFDPDGASTVVLPADHWSNAVGPYAGIGKTLALRVGVVDGFGNAAGTVAVEGTPLFTDALVPVAAWPQAAIRWSLDGAQVRGQLELNLDALAADTWDDARRSLTLVQNQLSPFADGSGVSATLSSTLGGQLDCLAALRTAVAAALAQLDTSAPADVTQDLGAFSPDWSAVDEIATLEVSLRVARDASLCASGAPDGVVATTVLLSAAQEEPALADALAASVPALRLFRGPLGELAVAPLGDGLTLTALPGAQCHALPPLATETVSLESVAMRSWPAGDTVIVDLDAFDLDLALRDLLAALDAVSRPGPSAAAAADPATAASWSTVMGARRTIAAGLAARVLPLDPATPASTETAAVARALFEQRLLTSLSDATSVDAVVLLPVQVAGATADNALLYGAVSVGDQPGDPGEGSVSTEARLALADGAQWLGFAWSRPSGSAPAEVALRPSFAWTHLENELVSRVVNGQTYTHGEWLRSVAAPPVVAGWGEVNVPVWPLDRAPGGSVTGTATLDPDAWNGNPANHAGLGWTYTLDVATTAAPITLTLLLNSGPATDPVRTSPDPDLADALARCAWEMPQLAADLAAGTAAAWARVAELATLVGEGLATWGTAPIAGQPAAPVAQVSYRYQLTFGDGVVTVEALDGGPLPALGFDGQPPVGGTVTGSSARWTATVPSTLAVAWTGLDPRNLEDARGAARPGLPPGLAIAAPFLPTAPVALAGASASPRAWFTAPLNLGTVPQAQLGDRLQAALVSLLSVTPLGTPDRGVRVEGELFVDQGGGAEVSFPLLLAPTLVFRLPDVTVDGVGLGQLLAQALVAARPDLTGRLHLRMAWLGGAEERPRALFGMDVVAEIE